MNAIKEYIMAHKKTIIEITFGSLPLTFRGLVHASAPLLTALTNHAV